MTAPENPPETAPRETEELLNCLRQESPDDRIQAIRALADAKRYRSEEERELLMRELLFLLRDGRTNTYVYGLWECEEQEPATRVCDAAAAVLFSNFGYAESVPGVFARARAAGYPIA